MERPPFGAAFFLATPAAGRSCRARGQKRRRPGIVSAPPDRHARQVSRPAGPVIPVLQGRTISVSRGGRGRSPARALEQARSPPQRPGKRGQVRSGQQSTAGRYPCVPVAALPCRQPEAARRQGGSLSRLKAGPPSIRMAALPKSSATDAAAMSPASGKPRTTLLGGPEGRPARVLSLTSEFPAAAVASSRGRKGRKILPRNLPI